MWIWRKRQSDAGRHPHVVEHKPPHNCPASAAEPTSLLPLHLVRIAVIIPAYAAGRESFKGATLARYYQLVRAGRTARRAGVLSLIFTVSELAVLMCLGRSTMSPADFVILAVIQLLPGAVVVSLARSAGDGNPTSLFVIFAVAVLAPARSVIAMFFGSSGSLGPLGFFCDVYTSVPLIWLAWTCNESLADVRQLIRRRREDRFGEPRGFEPNARNEVGMHARPGYLAKSERNCICLWAKR
jgi:hypothetical protein